MASVDKKRLFNVWFINGYHFTYQKHSFARCYFSNVVINAVAFATLLLLSGNFLLVVFYLAAQRDGPIYSVVVFQKIIERPAFAFILNEILIGELNKVPVLHLIKSVFYQPLHSLSPQKRSPPHGQRAFLAWFLYPALRQAAVISKSHFYRPLATGGIRQWRRTLFVSVESNCFPIAIIRYCIPNCNNEFMFFWAFCYRQ